MHWFWRRPGAEIDIWRIPLQSDSDESDRGLDVSACKHLSFEMRYAYYMTTTTPRLFHYLCVVTTRLRRTKYSQEVTDFTQDVRQSLKNFRLEVWRMISARGSTRKFRFVRDSSTNFRRYQIYNGTKFYIDGDRLSRISFTSSGQRCYCSRSQDARVGLVVSPWIRYRYRKSGERDEANNNKGFHGIMVS